MRRYKEINREKKILITGIAGFIGFHLADALLKRKIYVIGFDNLNDYYEVAIKEERLSKLNLYDSFLFIKGDLIDKSALESIFSLYKPDIVVNLAAQAGVRYSIENPDTYIQSNIIGFYNILECCRFHPVEHLLYASSSSVYGGNSKIPSSIDDKVDCPVSLYAATKKSNELFAYSYSKLYDIPCTGLRFFTVYGPLGRPDMAYYSFAQKIMKNEKIRVNNYGDMYRDFTYVEDVVEALLRMLCNQPVGDENNVRYKIYNVGNNKPERLLYLIECIEQALGREAKKDFYPMQPGDVYQTYADIEELVNDFDFKPKTSLKEGISKFIDWFLEYNCY